MPDDKVLSIGAKLAGASETKSGVRSVASGLSSVHAASATGAGQAAAGRFLRRIVALIRAQLHGDDTGIILEIGIGREDSKIAPLRHSADQNVDDRYANSYCAAIIACLCRRV